jgi:hypothetical protein
MSNSYVSGDAMPPQHPGARNINYAILPFLPTGFIIEKGGNVLS